ncbi:MAG: hypothetical protein HYV39_02955 [Candidatus Levybacteria bacterium]|nr:hypothetical protein [Candidatus Levybacteria bacterium]
MVVDIDELIWDQVNTEHIKKHEVNQAELYQACRIQLKVLLVKKNRILLIGKTKTNRLLSIVLDLVDNNNYYVVSARDSSRKERRLVNEEIN